MAAVGNLLCMQCGAILTGSQRKFCSRPCSSRFTSYVSYRISQARKKEGLNSAGLKSYRKKLNETPRHDIHPPNLSHKEIPEDAVKNPKLTVTDAYKLIDSYGYFERIKEKLVTEQAVAAELGIHQSTVSRCYANWVMNQRWRAERVTQESPLPPAPELTIENLDQLADHFSAFRTRYFQTPDGKPYLFPTHQRRWLVAILRTMIHGSKLEILSPPRHGKSELLAHFCVWLIVCVNPNIRIMVIGGNEDIASNSVGMVKDQLEDNEQLVQELCPSVSYKPGYKDGDPWTNTKFTVNTRTVAGIKSPTMIAIGRGGKILSRDADLIICDDIEDGESTYSADQREKTRRWWAITLLSRKEERTGLVVIGSRQHPDDLYGHILVDSAWVHIVEQIHNEDCPLEPEDLNAHTSCMLWPEVRTYRYMRDMMRDPAVRPHFAMVYMNQPQDSETSTFPRDLVDSCQDRRTTGQYPDEPAVRLIAGLDPAGTGYQASFLWAINQQTGDRYAVDMDNRLGGGIQRVREIVSKWFETYGVRWWVIEENAFQSAILRDEMLEKYALENSITIEGHSTGGNKWDPQLGVSTLATWMTQGKLWIPWGDADTEAKFTEYRRQLINFSREYRSRNKTDVVMASWFPEARIQEWIESWSREMDDAWSYDEIYAFDPLAYTPMAS